MVTVIIAWVLLIVFYVLIEYYEADINAWLKKKFPIRPPEYLGSLHVKIKCTGFTEYKRAIKSARAE